MDGFVTLTTTVLKNLENHDTNGSSSIKIKIIAEGHFLVTTSRTFLK